MSFLTATNLERLNEYINPVKMKGKVLIPIGLNELYVSKIDLTESRNKSPMIVLSIKKVDSDCAPIKEYFLCDHKLLNCCDARGVPFGILKLKKFTVDAFNYELQRRENLIKGIVDQIKGFKKAPFYGIVRYKKQLIYDDGQVAERKFARSGSEVGTPVVVYGSEIIQVSSAYIDYPVKYHSELILQLTEQEQRLFDAHLKKRDAIRS